MRVNNFEEIEKKFEARMLNYYTICFSNVVHLVQKSGLVIFQLYLFAEYFNTKYSK